MRKTLLSLIFSNIIAILLCHFTAKAQNFPIYQEADRAERNIKIEDGDYKYTIYLNDNWAFYGDRSPKITISINNSNYKKENFNIKCTITSDSDVPLYTFKQDLAIESNDSSLLSFAFNSPLPGIYNVKIENNNTLIKRFNISYEPSKIVLNNTPDTCATKYWDNIKDELSSTIPSYKLTKIKEKTGTSRDVFLVEIKSISRTIYGYYYLPRKRENHTTIIRLGDENIDSCNISSENNPDLIEFVFIDDKNIEKSLKENTKDILQIIDFLESRKIVNTDNIFISAKNKGALVGLAACALDSRIKGISIYTPYFNKSILDDKTITFRNLISKINKPTIFGFCLQDSLSKPRDNYEIYNSLPNKNKEYFLYILKEDQSEILWREIESNFYEKITRVF